MTGEVDVTNVEEFTHSVLARAGPAARHSSAERAQIPDSAGFAALDRLLEQNAIVLVLSPDSFMYRVAELMCLPIHHDPETARRRAAGAVDRELSLFDGLAELFEELVVVVTGHQVAGRDD